MRLDGRIAIVTGGASGFGRGIAELFAREGARVIVADINGKAAADVAQSLGHGALAVECSCSNAALGAGNADDVAGKR